MKDYITIHLGLIQIEVMEIIIVSMIHLVADVFQTKQEIQMYVFLNVITRMNGSKTLTKHISCGCKCKFMGRTRNSNQKWNNNKC